jgi:hypothetical protein
VKNRARELDVGWLVAAVIFAAALVAVGIWLVVVYLWPEIGR